MLGRRAFLAGAGVAVAGAVPALSTLSACSSSSPGGRPSGSPTTSASTSAPPTSGSASPTTGTFGDLADALHGDLVRPGDRGYRAATRLFDPRFDGAHPKAVAFCADADDVRRTVAFAREHDLPLALRSGGHSYGGWSTGDGLVLDVSRMARVRVDGRTATIGAGAELIDVYAGLAARGVALAAGSCPTVGITGLTLGGGVGVLTRAWGLTCDQLTGVDLVTADGALHHASASRDEELFWACRGGGGSQVGVVTSLRFRVHDAAPVTVYYLRWPWSRAAQVLRAWSRWSPSSDRRLWSTCKLLTQPGEAEPRVFVAGAWLGGAGDGGLGAELDALASAAGSAPSTRTASTYDYLSAMKREAGCPETPAAQCSTPRTSYDSASNMVLGTLSAATAALAVSEVERRQRARSDHEDGVSFDALGGAVGDLSGDATAFPWRGAVGIAQYNVTWSRGTPSATVDRGRAWLHGFRAAMTRHLGDHAYVNYADPSLDDFADAYYGANRARLADVRSRYDPDGVFAFPQSVPVGGA